MGRIIRIAFRGRKRASGAIRTDHRQEDRDEDSRDEQKCRTKGREKPLTIFVAEPLPWWWLRQPDVGTKKLLN
jgi:hypothetical protein